MLTLIHGTTLRRARSILQNGPNPHFIEPGGSIHDPANGFSTYIANGIAPLNATVIDYAQGKAKHFPNEGGAAIIEIDVPDAIVETVLQDQCGNLCYTDSGEIRFEDGMGLEELLSAWPSLVKRIVTL